MGEIIATTNIEREQGYLYYCSFTKDANINICKAKLSRGGAKSKDKQNSMKGG